MKTKTTLFITCLIAAVFSKAQTDTVNIFYPGYTNYCCTGNTTPYFCFNDNSAGCGSTASSSASTFINTVPAGNVITQVDVYYYTFNCPGTSATGMLNGMPLSTASILTGSCMCANDTMGWSITASSSNVYPCGIPGYNYGTGATETFYVSFTGAVCISQARIVLTYTTASIGTTPTISITASQDSVCSGTTVTLTASGGNTYTWNTGATTNTIAVSPVNSTTYNVVGISSTGTCLNMATQAIHVESINIQATQSLVCGGPASVTLTASGASNYTWMPGGMNTPAITVSPSITTAYTVTASTGTCIATPIVTTITVNPLPSASVTVSGGPPVYTLTANALPATYQWLSNNGYGCSGGYTPITGATNQTYTTGGGNYAVIITKNNCTDTSGCSTIAPLGIATFINNTQISIYPNPNNGNFIIETSTATKQTVMVYDVNGKLVLSQTINGKTTIDAGVLNEGVYNISMSSNEGVVNKRLVIVK